MSFFDRSSVANTKPPPENDGVGVYIHIPFCKRLCPYCDFLRLPVEETVPDAFIRALKHQIVYSSTDFRIKSIYFGGGTPSLLTPDQIFAILETIRSQWSIQEDLFRDIEITLEANPDDVNSSLARSWRQLGINRVSLGVQSFSDEVLRYLGRRHDAKAATRACLAIAEVFCNWNIDLIYGAHPIEHWNDSLIRCKEFQPSHVSTYSLTYEETTPFASRKHEAVDDEMSLSLYRNAQAILGREFFQYEISNFAKEGFQAQHNLIYWRNEEYLGFGPGAYSFIGAVRSRNATLLPTYLDAPSAVEEAIKLSDREIKLETLIQHFRLAKGISKAYYTKRFSSDITQDFGRKLQNLLERGLLVDVGDSIRPTQKGFELNNEIGLTLVD